MKKYIVTLVALALAIGGSINLTGCGKPAVAPTAKPEPAHVPDPATENKEGTDPLPPGGSGVGAPPDPKPAEKEKE